MSLSVIERLAGGVAVWAASEVMTATEMTRAQTRDFMHVLKIAAFATNWHCAMREWQRSNFKDENSDRSVRSEF